jgi:hypothetical protein
MMKMAQYFSWLKTRIHWDSLGEEGLFKMKLKKVKCEGVQWIYLTHNGIKLWNLVNTTTNLQSPQKKGICD